MKPPYQITAEITGLIATVSEKIGEVNAAQLQVVPAELRKKNRVRTIHASLAIEGNTLTIEQVSTVLNNKVVVGPLKDIQEVKNAIVVYEEFDNWKPSDEISFLKAHKLMLRALTVDAGKYRNKAVGIVKGKKLAHVAPPPSNVKPLMKQLFGWLKTSKEHPLIKACVFHYELEFIHPFSDGNGRMGRLWQSVILAGYNSVFRFLPVESMIRARQKEYYRALSDSDKCGASTPFIEFMLKLMGNSLEELLKTQRVVLKSEDRITLIPELFPNALFTRQDYMRHFKGISSATASRDLAAATLNGIIRKSGDKRKTVYKCL
jgi:Fic family protein